jgi:uncharacterized membrane protein YdfJ with MMPL/SSD domain
MASRRRRFGWQAKPPGGNHRPGQERPVIAAAAGIMVLVFGAFMFGTRQLAEFGFGLGFSALVDALLIRSLLVPALTHLIGPATWALPSWLSRILPRLAVEAAEPVPSGLDASRTASASRPTGPGHTAPNFRLTEGQLHE